MKTNGARFLESLAIPFELREYEVDPDDLSAITVAKKIGMPPEQVFKTLLTTDDRGDFVFAVVPGDAELDFKKLARAAGMRAGAMVTSRMPCAWRFSATGNTAVSPSSPRASTTETSRSSSRRSSSTHGTSFHSAKMRASSSARSIVACPLPS
jgi:hypothetical protein